MFLPFSVARDRKGTWLIFAISAFTFIFLFLKLNNVDHTSIATTILHHSETLLASNTCSSPRSQNLNRIPLPEPVDLIFLRAYWAHVKEIFETHPPTPLSVPRINFKILDYDNGHPSVDLVKSLFNVTDEDATKTREAHAEVVKKLPSYPQLRAQYSGRGIVILAGSRYSEYAATSLGVLRELGSELPVEVWYKDESEDTPGWCEELATEGMACRKLADYIDIEVLKNPYSWKVFTIFLSSFEEVIFLDADSLPLKKPDDLFDSSVYRDNGAIVWPDYWLNTGSPRLRYIIGQSEAQEEDDWIMRNHTVDSGQLMWNKKDHWKSLLLAMYYNYYPDYYFTILNNGADGWGDKDTFSTALFAMNERFYQVPQEIKTVFLTPEKLTDRVVGVGMAQSDPRCTDEFTKDDCPHKPLFLHANSIKWSMRDFLGINTFSANDNDYHRSLLAMVEKGLEEGIPIYDPENFKDVEEYPYHEYPEAMMWRAVEHSACRSAVWGDDRACERVRKHMTRTFGYSFVPNGGRSWLSKDREEVCMIAPGSMVADGLS